MITIALKPRLSFHFIFHEKVSAAAARPETHAEPGHALDRTTVVAPVQQYCRRLFSNLSHHT